MASQHIVAQNTNQKKVFGLLFPKRVIGVVLVWGLGFLLFLIHSPNVFSAIANPIHYHLDSGNEQIQLFLMINRTLHCFLLFLSVPRQRASS